MQIDPASLSKNDGYKLIANLVVPRPIAWITSINQAGVVNLAPFSFFNAIGSDPLYIAVGIGQRPDGSPKDTAKNIMVSGEFVVNMVTEDLLAAMNISAAEFPPDESEIEAAKLQTSPSAHVKPPRLTASQASLECKLFQAMPLGSGTLIIGEVVMFHVADHLLGKNWHIDNFAPIGRLGSPSFYCRTTDRFDLPRMTYAQWQQQQD